jgi:diguanylate cyclase (GGDEF)-like protein
VKDLPKLLVSPLLSILESASERIAIIASDSARIVYSNPALREWLGDSAQLESGHFIHELLASGDAQQSVIEKISAVADATSGPALLRAFGHPPQPVRVRVCRMRFEGVEFYGILISRADEEFAVLPDWNSWRRDPLTELRDRTFLLSRLDALLRGDRAADQRYAVLFIDLDDFKQVNDAYGHLVGDRVLREVARRLTSCVRAHDHVVRFGGDEFVVLAEQLTAPSDIETIVGRIHRVLETPISLPEGAIVLTLSIGVAEASADSRTPEDLLAAADRAMYASKHSSG